MIKAIIFFIPLENKYKPQLLQLRTINAELLSLHEEMVVWGRRMVQVIRKF